MTREASPALQETYKKKFPDLNPLFTFAVPGYNMRNQEMNAVLGISQLKRLDYNSEKRSINFNTWVDNLNSSKYFINFERNGNSNFALPLIVLSSNKNLFKKVCEYLDSKEVEYRIGTAGGGNQARQPYLKPYDIVTHDLKNVNYIHEYR